MFLFPITVSSSCMCVNKRQSNGWPYSVAHFWSCEQGGLSVLTKGNPQGHATGPVEPLEWSPSHHIQSAFYLLVCTQRGTYPSPPALALTSPPSIPPPHFIMRRSQVLPLHNKNLPPWPNNRSRPGRRDHLKSIQQRMGDLILPPERERREAQRGRLSSTSELHMDLFIIKKKVKLLVRLQLQAIRCTSASHVRI